jgi:hypothetical protein
VAPATGASRVSKTLPKTLAPPLVLPLVEVLVEFELDVELLDDPVVVVPPAAVVEVVPDSVIVEVVPDAVVVDVLPAVDVALDPMLSVAWVESVACMVVELSSPVMEMLVETGNEVCGEDPWSPPHPAIAKMRAMTTTVAVKTRSNLLRDIDLAVIGSLGSLATL